LLAWRFPWLFGFRGPAVFLETRQPLPDLDRVCLTLWVLTAWLFAAKARAGMGSERNIKPNMSMRAAKNILSTS
jgi:hypothetical protein